VLHFYKAHIGDTLLLAPGIIRLDLTGRDSTGGKWDFVLRPPYNGAERIR
jgi:hypothetical protein